MRVFAALATPQDRSGAAPPEPVDGLGMGARRAICALLALGTLAIAYFFWSGLATNDDPTLVMVMSFSTGC